MSRAVLCLPTYNERENLEPMIRALGEVLDTTRDRVLVIDDGSPDGTGEIADRLAAELGWVSVLHRETKEGIGPAYIAGFRQVLADGAELVLEMDCDFSHDPADVPRLIAAADEADLALGSRYAPGGGTANWGLVRRIVSRGGCLYAQILLGMRVRDLTGGFKCFRRAALEAIDLDALSAHGYAFQIEASYRVHRAGLRIQEVPITFVERRAGASKMTGSIVAEAMWRVPLLRLRALTGKLWRVTEVGAAEIREPRSLASPIPVIVDLLGTLVPAVRGGRAAPRASPASGVERVRLVRVNVDEEARPVGTLRRPLPADGDPLRRRRAEGDRARSAAAGPFRARVRPARLTVLPSLA